MKSEGAIRHKLKQVRFRYLKRRIEGSLDRRPENCTHNGVMDGSDAIRACFLQVDVTGRRGVVCDERFGGCARAGSCPHFALRHDKNSVKSEFYTDLDAMSFPEIAYNYPDMAALLWVLADEGLDVPRPDPNEFDLSEPTTPPDPGVASTPAPEPSPITPEVVYDPTPEPTPTREPDPDLPVRSPTWIDRLLGRVPS